MPKCKNCGREFEGSFCPECGMKCGEDPLKYAAVGNGGAGALTKVYPALGFVPALLLALFAVLVFAFLAAPVAVMDMQELGSQSLGSAYSVFKSAPQSGEELGELEELMGLSAISGMKTVIIVAIVFAAVTAAYAVLSLAFTFNRYHRNVGVKLASGVNFSKSRIISLAGAVLYIAVAVVGGVMLSKVSSADELGMLKAGACPALLIAFGVVFAVLTVVEEVVRIILIRKYPDCKKGEDCYLALVDEYAKSLSAPEKPEIPQAFRQEMHGLGEEEMRSKLKRAGKQAFMNSINVMFVGVACIAASVVMFTMGASFGAIAMLRMMRIVLIFVGIAALALGAFLITRPKPKFARAEKAYARHTKLFEKGKNYKGSKGFNEWLTRGRNQTAE